MKEKKMTICDEYMFVWSVLRDLVSFRGMGCYNSMTDEEEKAIEDTMTLLSKRYMDRAMSALRGGTKKDDPVLECSNDVLRQRIMAFNEHLKREPKE